MSRPLCPRLNARPLLDALPPIATGRRNFSSNTNKVISRAAAQGSITVYAADRIAVGVLGKHPAEIWGDEWRLAWREVD